MKLWFALFPPLGQTPFFLKIVVYTCTNNFSSSSDLRFWFSLLLVHTLAPFVTVSVDPFFIAFPVPFLFPLLVKVAPPFHSKLFSFSPVESPNVVVKGGCKFFGYLLFSLTPSFVSQQVHGNFAAYW